MPCLVFHRHLLDGCLSAELGDFYNTWYFILKKVKKLVWVCLVANVLTVENLEC